MTENSKVVIVYYSVMEAFRVPDNIDLENTGQVKFWGVKYNRLHILLVDGQEIIIEAEGWVQQEDFKEPNGQFSPSIEFATDWNLEQNSEME